MAPGKRFQIAASDGRRIGRSITSGVDPQGTLLGIAQHRVTPIGVFTKFLVALTQEWRLGRANSSSLKRFLRIAFSSLFINVAARNASAGETSAYSVK